MTGVTEVYFFTWRLASSNEILMFCFLRANRKPRSRRSTFQLGEVKPTGSSCSVTLEREGYRNTQERKRFLHGGFKSPSIPYNLLPGWWEGRAPDRPVTEFNRTQKT